MILRQLARAFAGKVRPANDIVDRLRDIQSRHVASLQPDADGIEVAARAIYAEVGGLHDVASHLVAAADKYASTAAKRLRTGRGGTAAYEINRAINAANHEAMRLAYGVHRRVRWIGGAHDGQVRGISETWGEGLRHPPIREEETDCFLIPE